VNYERNKKGARFSETQCSSVRLIFSTELYTTTEPLICEPSPENNLRRI